MFYLSALVGLTKQVQFKTNDTAVTTLKTVSAFSFIKAGFQS